MARKLLLASAGAGKSMWIAEQALNRAASGGRVLLLTYTINNQFELVRHICRLNKVQPPNVTVKGWFSFLLEDMVRPYQRCIVPQRISGILLNAGNPHLGKGMGGKTFNLPGRAEKIDGRYNPLHYVTKENNSAHTHYLAKLAARINELTDGMPARRLAEIYDAVFVDEVQDLVGWDYAVIRTIVNTGICEFDCVGDFRQAIYQTAETTKKPQTNTEKMDEFVAMAFEVDNSLAISRRCIQSICDLADRVHIKDGLYAPTKSQIASVPLDYAGHLGVFAVHGSHIEDYIKTYNPVILRWNRRTKEFCDGRTVYNLGESKGLGFERVLMIKPPNKHAKFLSGDTSAFCNEKTDDSRNKLYVGITRARYSFAFLHEGGSVIIGAQIWGPCD